MMNTENKRKPNLLPYLKLNGDIYSLELLENEALKIGLSKEDYEQAIKSIDHTNQQIIEIRKDPNTTLNLFDPSSFKSANSEDSGFDPASDLMSSGSGGTITTTGQEEGEGHATARDGDKRVIFRCRTNAAWIPVYTCRLKLGAHGTWQVSTHPGFLMATTDISIDLDLHTPTQEYYCTFRTTDSNGGTCHYSTTTS